MKGSFSLLFCIPCFAQSWWWTNCCAGKWGESHMIQFSTLATNCVASFSANHFLLVSSHRGGGLCVAYILRLGVHRTSHYENTVVIRWPAGDLTSAAFYNIPGWDLKLFISLFLPPPLFQLFHCRVIPPIHQGTM